MRPALEAFLNTIRTARIAVLILTVTLAASACGSNDKDDAAKSAAPAKASSVATSAASSAELPAASSSPASTGDASEDCGAAEMEVRAGLASSGYVTDVRVMGQCTMVSVSTSLAADTDGAMAAKGLCEIAAVQAYSKGIGSVSIDAKDGTELAIGIKDAPCIAQPR